MASDRPRLLILNHSALLGGGEIALALSANVLNDVFEVRAAVPGPGPLVDLLQDAGIPVFDSPLGVSEMSYGQLSRLAGPVRLGAGFVVYTRQLHRETSRWSPDLIYVNSLKSALYGQMLAALVRAPWVWHLRDRLEPGYLSKIAVAMLRGLAAIGPRKIITNSEGTKSLLSNRARSRALVIPSPIDVDDFAATVGTQSANGDSPVTFGVVARLTPIKGQYLVLEAFARIPADCDCRLRLVGGDLTADGGQREELLDLAERLGIGDRVEMTGQVDLVEEEFRLLDVLVSYPSFPEPFGQSVVQAMAAHVAVIAADEGGPSELIEHEATGILVPARDPTALGLAMTELALSPTRRVQLADAAAPIADGYSPDVILPRLVAVLEDACVGGTRPAAFVERRGHRKLGK